MNYSYNMPLSQPTSGHSAPLTSPTAHTSSPMSNNFGQAPLPTLDFGPLTPDKVIDWLAIHNLAKDFQLVSSVGKYWRKLWELQTSSLDLWDVGRDFGFSLCAAPLSDSCPKILEQEEQRIRDWRIGVKVRVVLGVELRGWESRGELIWYLNQSIYMTSLRYLY